jgi:dTDP-4-dehydrorhamnose reductase
MLGGELTELFAGTGTAYIGSDREVDITDSGALAAFAEKRAASGGPIRCIINCAAYTAVDKAEDDAENCRRLNTLGAGNVAACAKDIGARLIQLSTDYVFDGEGIVDISGGLRPYCEVDVTGPTGVYGLTKRDGERAAVENSEAVYIIRTAWLYGKHGGNFVGTMLRMMNERDEVRVVADQRGSPTWAGDLAAVIARIIKAVDGGREPPYGVYHYTNGGDITWYDFAQAIYRGGRRYGLITKECAVRPCTGAEYPGKARRPAYSALDTGKIRAALGITIPAWDESLDAYLRRTAGR